ncbi:hypothetical protein BV25DRAFT_1409373 [Artomyces pyxidatus]|uniref:Uncharacterized protein n=1 Tax=Artomyces pyxidatus TaxID=48021 RepID=A0ACB8TDU9_9AGAM|nr:hypothetical protein BV25DRAFT_1409373 [Artomyces pyxidatus]
MSDPYHLQFSIRPEPSDARFITISAPDCTNEYLVPVSVLNIHFLVRLASPWSSVPSKDEIVGGMLPYLPAQNLHPSFRFSQAYGSFLFRQSIAFLCSEGASRGFHENSAFRPTSCTGEDLPRHVYSASRLQQHVFKTTHGEWDSIRSTKARCRNVARYKPISKERTHDVFPER